MPFDGHPPTWPLCTQHEVARIASRRDPIRRNLEITQSYHRLTVAVGQRLGRRDLPWTGYAVWASKTAGHFIRGDWKPEELSAMLDRRDGLLSRMLTRVEASVRAHVAEGNRLVYTEIAPLFVELVAILDAPLHQREARADALEQRLRPGPVHEGGQDGLIRAARAYLDAAACDDPQHHAQLVLLGNLEIGYHEQWRLQGSIQGALEATLAALPSARGPAWLVLRRLVGRLRRLLTRSMMRLHTPEGVLHMGRDVPELPGGRMFPASLERVQVPALRELLARIDRTPDSTHGSAARDWADFGDRMNYVADMFRVLQQIPALWQPPFSPSQVDALRRERVPVGPL